MILHWHTSLLQESTKLCILPWNNIWFEMARLHKSEVSWFVRICPSFVRILSGLGITRKRLKNEQGHAQIKDRLQNYESKTPKNLKIRRAVLELCLCPCIGQTSKSMFFKKCVRTFQINSQTNDNIAQSPANKTQSTELRIQNAQELKNPSSHSRVMSLSVYRTKSKIHVFGKCLRAFQITY